MKLSSPRKLFTIAPIALALLTLVLLPATLLAQPPGRGGGPGHFGPRHGGPGFGGPGFGGDLSRMAERLGLTQEQQDSIQVIRESFRDTLESQRQALGDLRASLQEKVHAETLDEAAIRQAAANMAEAHGDLAVTEAQMFHEIRGVLTPEQIAQLEEMRELRQERMEARREHREARRNAAGQ